MGKLWKTLHVRLRVLWGTSQKSGKTRGMTKSMFLESHSRSTAENKSEDEDGKFYIISPVNQSI